jgi:hypothetical protein
MGAVAAWFQERRSGTGRIRVDNPKISQACQSSRKWPLAAASAENDRRVHP